MRKIFNKDRKSGFTLIELLVVISIIGIIISLSLFGIKNVRKSARDTQRKSDLETIRAALELYRADCNSYPASTPDPGESLKGNGTGSCLASNTYLQEWPSDPLSDRNYSYTLNGNTYTLCAALENDTSGNGNGCGSCGDGISCNYKTINP